MSSCPWSISGGPDWGRVVCFSLCPPNRQQGLPRYLSRLSAERMMRFACRTACEFSINDRAREFFLVTVGRHLRRPEQRASSRSLREHSTLPLTIPEDAERVGRERLAGGGFVSSTGDWSSLPGFPWIAPPGTSRMRDRESVASLGLQYLATEHDGHTSAGCGQHHGAGGRRHGGAPLDAVSHRGTSAFMVRLGSMGRRF